MQKKKQKKQKKQEKKLNYVLNCSLNYLGRSHQSLLSALFYSQQQNRPGNISVQGGGSIKKGIGFSMGESSSLIIAHSHKSL